SGVVVDDVARRAGSDAFASQQVVDVAPLDAEAVGRVGHATRALILPVLEGVAAVGADLVAAHVPAGLRAHARDGPRTTATRAPAAVRAAPTSALVAVVVFDHPGLFALRGLRGLIAGGLVPFGSRGANVRAFPGARVAAAGAAGARVAAARAPGARIAVAAPRAWVVVARSSRGGVVVARSSRGGVVVTRSSRGGVVVAHAARGRITVAPARGEAARGEAARGEAARGEATGSERCATRRRRSAGAERAAGRRGCSPGRDT